ncbi:GPP34 family phosphoprotein [Geodermatophilus aquaeductus]|uniref:GPP34 family phosphoprotein n=1 Tax=Geodermatophilus aquaeductus TaxID=1564161 RepID=UPI001159DE40
MESVAITLALLCLESNGKPTQSLWADYAIRSGLLADLSLTGQLIEQERHIILTDPIQGPKPHQELALEILKRPDRSLTDHIKSSKVGLSQMCEQLLELGHWRTAAGRWPVLRRRYRATSDDYSRKSVETVLVSLTGTGVQDPRRAAAAAIARAAGLLTGQFLPVDESLIAACGVGEWIVRVGVGYIESARIWHRTVSRATVRDLGSPG